MSFREKSAWISFVLLLIVLAAFFTTAARISAGEIERNLGFRIEIGLLVGFVALEILLHAGIALQAPDEARAGRDEREQLIAMRATRNAFPVLVLGSLGSVGLLHVTSSAWQIGHHVLLAIMVALLVKFGWQIVYFRQGV